MIRFYTLHDGARLAFESMGSGMPLILMHSGWGRLLFNFESQIEFFSPRYRVLMLDRRGYGQSSHVTNFPLDFHQRSADDTLEWVAGLGIERAILWGHSDGAVISALMALAAPDRVAALILEAAHFYRSKPASLDFFCRCRDEPERFGSRVVATLATEHGEDYWRSVLRWDSLAWLALGEIGGDVYDGRLPQIIAPTLFLHGAHDFHTPVHEIETMAEQIPGARLQIFEDGEHSPHSESRVRDRVNQIVQSFLEV